MIFLRETVFLILLSTLVALDWKRGRMPVWISYLGMAFSVLCTVYLIRTPEFTWSHAGLGIVAAYLVSGILAMVPGLMNGVYRGLPERNRFGGQDYAFIAMAGGFTGPVGIFPVFILALLAGSILPMMGRRLPFSLLLAASALLFRYAGTPLMGAWFGF